MTPAEWTALLDVVAKVEAIEAHLAERIHRDPHGLQLARDAARAVKAAVAVAAPGTARLNQPERLEWARIPLASRVLGITYAAARRRAERGLHDGTGRRGEKRNLELHLPSQPEVADG